jgi:hypothetical protein
MTLFPETYQESRARFLSQVDGIRTRWPGVLPLKHMLGVDPGLSIDWLTAPAIKTQQNLVILSTGEHGVEGFVGSAMLQMFIEEFLPHLNPNDTGLLLIHAINPWGMANRERNNASNIDLNRNFIASDHYDPLFNPTYDQLRSLLVPQRRIDSVAGETLRFFSTLLGAITRHGISVIKEGTLMGQYRHPQGVYFGGHDRQEETGVLMDLLENAMADYQNIVHLDMHTGYGPRYQMSLVNSPLDELSSVQSSTKFNYPLVVKANPEEFYSIRGDMINFEYELRNQKFPDKTLYATAFEFGTFGDSLPALIRSLRAEVLDNQLKQFGVKNEKTAAQVRGEFCELFYPVEERWREKALTDGRQAFAGILKALIPSADMG